MNLYMRERLVIPENEIPFLREQYFKMYGTTLRGLQERHNVDKDDFLAFVHDLPLKDYLTPNPVLRDVIASLPTRNLVFTNADISHARRVLAALQLDDLFEMVVDVNAVAPYCKPMRESFAIAMDLADEPDPRKLLFRQLYFDTACFDPAILRFAATVVPVEHFVMGSDAPFPLVVPNPVTFVRDALPPEAASLVLSRNFDRLIGE